MQPSWPRFASNDAMPVKQQITPTSMWKRSIDQNPEELDPARFVPEKALERMTIPFTVTAEGPLPPTPYPALPPPKDRFLRRGLKKTLVSMRRTVKVTKGGKVVSMSALVVVGDGNGVVGYGEGKAAEAALAVQKATARAVSQMIPIHRYDERTILHDIQHKFKATMIQLRAAPPGTIFTAICIVSALCQL
jgi:hypothetical protein